MGLQSRKIPEDFPIGTTWAAYANNELTDTTLCSAALSNITEMRAFHKDAFLKKHNIKLGFMSAFVKASAYALADQPSVNAGESETALRRASSTVSQNGPLNRLISRRQTAQTAWC